jgi:hypothetical protein
MAERLADDKRRQTILKSDDDSDESAPSPSTAASRLATTPIVDPRDVRFVWPRDHRDGKVKRAAVLGWRHR